MLSGVLSGHDLSLEINHKCIASQRVLLVSGFTILIDLSFLNVLIIDSLDNLIPVLSDLLRQLDLTTFATLQQAISPAPWPFSNLINTLVLRAIKSVVQISETRTSRVLESTSCLLLLIGCLATDLALLGAASVHLILKSLSLLLLLKDQLLLMLLIFNLFLLNLIDLDLSTH